MSTKEKRRYFFLSINIIIYSTKTTEITIYNIYFHSDLDPSDPQWLLEAYFFLITKLLIFPPFFQVCILGTPSGSSSSSSGGVAAFSSCSSFRRSDVSCSSFRLVPTASNASLVTTAGSLRSPATRWNAIQEPHIARFVYTWLSIKSLYEYNFVRGKKPHSIM